MKMKILIILVLALSAVPGLAMGLEEGGVTDSVEGRLYLGGSFNWEIENLRGSLHDLDWEDSPGFSIGGGYFVSENFAVEALFRYHLEFKHEESESLPSWWSLVSDPSGLTEYEYREKVRLSGFDLSLNAKYYLPFGEVRPYGVAGFGYGRWKLKVNINEHYRQGDLVSDNSYSETDTEWGFSGRAGVGCDIFLSERVGINGEVAYNAGFGDIANVQFTALSLGVRYIF